MSGRYDSTAAVPVAIAHNPHFERIGGAAVIAGVVDAFYRNMATLAEAAAIRALHPADLGHSRDVLTKYLVGWLGGPPLYVSERGSPRLRQRHLPFAIGDAERDAWLLCMRLALEEHVADAQLRAELLQALLRTANALRNR